jgi:next-to-BRCA1 protein 1
MEAQKRAHREKEDARLEDKLLEMCIKESMAEKKRYEAELLNENTSDDQSDKKLIFSTATETDTESPTIVPNDSQVSEDKTIAKPSKLKARFVNDVTMPDGSEIAPCSTFYKTWRVRNDGESDWPDGCHLVSAGGDFLLDPKQGNNFVLRQPVPVTLAGSEIELTVELCAPSTTGRHVGYFRLENPEGSFFGQRLWADIRVHEADMSVSMTLVPWEVIEENDVKLSTSLEHEEEKHELDNSNESTYQNESDFNVDKKSKEISSCNEVETEEKSSDVDHLSESMSRWSHELQVLSAMGFYDFTQLLPILEEFITVPKSERQGDEDNAGYEGGLQAVVLSLLSNQE